VSPSTGKSLLWPSVETPRIAFGLEVRDVRASTMARYRSIIRTQFEQAATKAQVPGATPHALRHRAGSVLMHAGVPSATMARALGHTERVLLDIYSHAMPEGDDLLRDAMAQRPQSGTDEARKGLRAAQ
jgi:integrase